MSVLNNNVFGDIVESRNDNEILITKVRLWENDTTYNEEFIILEEDSVILRLSSDGKLKINRRYLLNEDIVESNNKKYLKISFEKLFKKINWNKTIPNEIYETHEVLLKNENCLNEYHKISLNYFEGESENRHFSFRFSRKNKMLNIIIKNNKMYLLLKLNEVYKDRDRNYIYY